MERKTPKLTGPELKAYAERIKNMCSLGNIVYVNVPNGIVYKVEVLTGLTPADIITDSTTILVQEVGEDGNLKGKPFRANLQYISQTQPE